MRNPESWVWMSLVCAIFLSLSSCRSGSHDSNQTAASVAAPPAASRHEFSWWTDMTNQFNDRAKQGAANGDIGLIFLGDSITQGWAQTGVWQEFYGHRDAVNFGIGGDRTDHVLWRLQHGNVDGLDKPAKGTPPRLVVLMIGTNNHAVHSAEEIGAGIRAIVEELRLRLPTTKILLLAIFPRSQTPDATRDQLHRASELARTVADGTMVHYLDIAPAFVEADGSIRPEVMPDYLHLSEDGYRRWAMAIEPKVKELMGE